MMKKITIILTVILITIITSVSAQNGLYQTIEQNGATTEYREFYRIGKGETPGTTFVNTEGERYWVTASITKTESGEKIGYELTKVDGSGSLTSADELSRYDRAIGYPNVSYIYHTKENDGLIATGDYIIKLSGITKDGTSFKSIESVFVKKQVKEEKEDKKEATSDAEEPKKKSKFLDGLKKFASSAGDLGMSLEAKKLKSVDIYQIATDYLIAIKAKQNSYTLTASDKAEINKIEALRNAKYADIKKANDAYWASPEGQAHYKSYGNNNSKSSTYTIKNTTGRTVQVGQNGGATYLANGSSKTVSCNSPIYIMELNGNSLEQSRLISDGKNVCGKTVTF